MDMTILASVPQRCVVPVALLDELRARFGDRFATGQEVRNQHGRDESPYPTMAPDAVVFALTTADVATVVTLCAAHQVPVIAFGAGSSIEGHVLAVGGGICIDLSLMNRILAVDVDDLTATVEAGVTRKQLNAEIKGHGLLFPIDPGADASIGGMVATRASGTNAVRYGTMRENTISLTVVTSQGNVIRTARRARKSSAGFDLTRLYVGSEGTLGIITEITLRLYPLPEAVTAAVCSFPEVAQAVNTVIQLVQLGIPVARAELLDALAVTAINRYSKTSLREQPMLFLEFHGSPSAVQEQARQAEEIAQDNDGESFEWATQPEDRSRLWNARHTAFLACLQLKKGCRAFTTDACVPISRLAECISRTIDETRRSVLPCPLFGHVGDGNFHCIILADPGDRAQMEEAERLNRFVMRLALELDGTCTGEHGVGLHKKSLLVEEHGVAAVEIMRQIKRALDPLGILNPHKVVDVI